MNPQPGPSWFLLGLLVVLGIAMWVIARRSAANASNLARPRSPRSRWVRVGVLAAASALVFVSMWQVGVERSPIATIGNVAGVAATDVPDRAQCVVALTDPQQASPLVPVLECVIELNGELQHFDVGSGMDVTFEPRRAAQDPTGIAITMHARGWTSFSMSAGSGTTMRPLPSGDGGLPFYESAGLVKVRSRWFPLVETSREARVFLRMLRPGERLEPHPASRFVANVGGALRDVARTDVLEPRAFIRDPEVSPRSAIQRLLSEVELQGGFILFCALWFAFFRSGRALSSFAIAAVSMLVVGGLVLRTRAESERERLVSTSIEPSERRAAAAALASSVVFPAENGDAFLQAYGDATDAALRFDLVLLAAFSNDALSSSPGVARLLERAGQDADPAIRALAQRGSTRTSR